MIGVINTVAMPLVGTIRRSSRRVSNVVEAGVRVILATSEVIEDPLYCLYAEEAWKSNGSVQNISTIKDHPLYKYYGKSDISVVPITWMLNETPARYIIVAIDNHNRFMVLDIQNYQKGVFRVSLSEIKNYEEQGLLIYPPWNKEVYMWNGIPVQRYKILPKRVQSKALEIVEEALKVEYKRFLIRSQAVEPREQGGVLTDLMMPALDWLSVRLKSVLGEYKDTYDFYYFWRNMFYMMVKSGVPFAVTENFKCIADSGQADGRVIVSTVGITGVLSVWAKLGVNPYKVDMKGLRSYEFGSRIGGYPNYAFFIIMNSEGVTGEVQRVMPLSAITFEAERYGFISPAVQLTGAIGLRRFDMSKAKWQIKPMQGVTFGSVKARDLPYLEFICLPKVAPYDVVSVQIADCPNLKEIRGLGQYRVKYLEIAGTALERIDLRGLNFSDVQEMRGVLSHPTLKEVVLPVFPPAKDAILQALKLINRRYKHVIKVVQGQSWEVLIREQE